MLDAALALRRAERHGWPLATGGTRQRAKGARRSHAEFSVATDRICIPIILVDLWKNGKTVTRILTDDQLADYQPWFDNQRRLRDLITELETLSQETADNDPRWQR